MMGNQVIDARGRKVTKRVVDIRELNEQAKVIDDLNSKIGDVDDFPEVRVDPSCAGPRVTFNIQDPVNLSFFFHMLFEQGQLRLIVRFQGSFAVWKPSQESVFSAPATPVAFSPTLPFQHYDSKRDDPSSSSSEDSEKEDELEREKQRSYRRPFQTSHRKTSGFSTVSQMLSERWASPAGSRSFSGPASEKNIDFELDIRVEIDSGKCVLHPVTQQSEHEEISLRRSCDRSLRSLDQDSPPKKKKLHPVYNSTTHLLAGKKCPSTLQTKSNDLETTVFYIPGVDVKLHYNSKTLKTESPSASRGSSLPRTLSKESKLYGMNDSGPTNLPSAVQSKTNSLLPPPPPPVPAGKSIGGVKMAKLYAWVALQTLPEEMVISPCLLDFLEKALETIPITPVERNNAAVATQEEDMGQFDPVEPLEESTTSLVSSSTSAYSSFPVDVVVYVRVQPSQIRFSCLPMSRVECMLKLPSLDLVFSSNRGELETPTGANPTDRSHPPSSTPPGQHVPKLPPTKGLSFTACMSDFSLYVFHPYGAGKQKSAVTGLPPGPGPLAVCDIGSASFKYDMRRLGEILAFPRAWYRRSIARRLFLGDQTINLPPSGPATPDSAESLTQHLSPESTRKAYWRTWDGSTGTHTPQSPNVFSEHSAGNNMSPGGLGHLKSPAPGRTRSVSDSSAPRRGLAASPDESWSHSDSWFCLVFSWTTSGLKSQGRLSVGSNRDREISMSVGLGRSKLDSKGGVVGGNIDVNTLEMVCKYSPDIFCTSLTRQLSWTSHPNQQPSHKIQITMGSTEARVDYMGSSILMGVFSNADLQLQDEWKVNLCTVDSSLSEKRYWDIFQVIISRSTTPDLIKIGMKLQEFFTQQFDTSKRALSTWGPGSYLPPKTPVINAEKGAAELCKNMLGDVFNAALCTEREMICNCN
ncbi:hypothetical protein GOODEAATRI_001872 [Goodea atripinnis]|uniref:Bridge-like lipid transfer protein family member 1 C-terminal domain-containing protein n=1 Tax=Goodea atripinnis TaxID=208336 RepID=A0ABV0P0L8_9TELE